MITTEQNKMQEQMIIRDYLKQIKISKNVTLPSYNLTEFIKLIDLDVSFRTRIVAAVCVMNAYFKEQNKIERKRNVLLASENHNNKPKLSKRKTTYFDSIHDSFMTCKSKTVLIATAWFGLNRKSEYILRDVIYRILSDDSITMDDILNLETPNNLKAFLKIDIIKPDIQIRKSLTHAFITISELLNSSTAALLASSFKFNMYLEFCESCEYKNIVVYTPMFEYYIKNMIPLFQQSNRLVALIDSFNIQPESVVKNTIALIREQLNIKEMNKELKKDTKSKIQKITKQPFNNDIVYHVFTMPIRTNLKLTSSSMKIDNSIYFVRHYNSMIYDICGKDGTLFDNMNWQQRLDSVKSPMKIVVDEIKGSDLNQYISNCNENCEIMVSWMANEKTNICVHQCLKKKTKKRVV